MLAIMTAKTFSSKNPHFVMDHPVYTAYTIMVHIPQHNSANYLSLMDLYRTLIRRTRLLNHAMKLDQL